jgi:hypothetical protein
MDIIVIGTPSSGSSFTAQQLAIQYGVCFGHHKAFTPNKTKWQGPRKWGFLETIAGENFYNKWTGEFKRELDFIRKVHPDCTAKIKGIKNNSLGSLSCERWFELHKQVGFKLFIWPYRPPAIIYKERCENPRVGLVGATTKLEPAQEKDFQIRFRNPSHRLHELYAHPQRPFEMVKLNFHEGIDEEEFHTLINPYMTRL